MGQAEPGLGVCRDAHPCDMNCMLVYLDDITRIALSLFFCLSRPRWSSRRMKLGSWVLLLLATGWTAARARHGVLEVRKIWDNDN
jgi:hypothetical protein